MADFEKVYSIKFETRRAELSLRNLDNKLESISKESKAAGKNMQRGMGVKGARAIDKLNKKVDKLRTGLQSVSRKAAAVAAGFAALGGVSVRNAIKLNKAMADVSTLLDGNVTHVRALKKGIQELAVESGKDTEDLAKGLYEVVSAFGEGAENMDQLRIAMRAGVAGGASTLDAVKLLSAVTKGYGDTSAEAQQHASDLAFQTVKLGQTTFPELAASMGRVIPLAAQMETSQEELFGTMATLTGVTGNAAEVSTELASIYSAFLKPTEAMGNAVDKINKSNEEYNFQSGTAMLKTLGLQKTLILLNESVDGNEESLAALLKRKEALVATLPLLSKQSETYAKKTEKMNSVIGLSDEAYRRQTEGINAQGHSWEQTKQRMIVFSQRLGDRLLPVLERLLNAVEPILNAIENMDKYTMDSIISMGKWAGIIAIAARGLSGMLGTVQALGTLRNLTTGMGNVASGMDGIGSSATVAAGKVKNLMGKIGALAGALGIGIGVGTAIFDIVVEPAEARRYEKGFQEENVMRTAKSLARTGGTAKEHKASIAELDKIIKRKGQLRKEDIGVFETPGQAKERLTGERAAAIKQKKAITESFGASNLARYLGGAGPEDYRVSQQQTAPTQTINNNNITIDATGMDEEKLARAIKRQIRHVPGSTAAYQQSVPEQ